MSGRNVVLLAVIIGAVGVAGASASWGATPKGAPIKVGMIADLTRPDGNFPFIKGGAQARADSINARGGINGRPVRFIACDDKGDPNVGTACARTMVREKVVAVVGTTSITEAQVFPILENAGIPSIATIPVSSVSEKSKVSFAFSNGIAGGFLAVPQMLVGVGRAKHPGFVYPGNIPGLSDALLRYFNIGVAKVRVTAGPIVPYDFGTTIYTAQAVKATSGNADAVFAFGIGSSQASLTRAIRQQSPNMVIGTLSSNFSDPSQIKFLGEDAEGILLVGQGKPPTSTVPGIKLYNADMKKYEPKEIRNDISINSWVGMWTFERLARAMKGPITRAKIFRAVSNLNRMPMGGIYPPITTTRPATSFPGLDRIFNKYVDLQTIRNGQIVSIGKNFANPFPE